MHILSSTFLKIFANLFKYAKMRPHFTRFYANLMHFYAFMQHKHLLRIKRADQNGLLNTLYYILGQILHVKLANCVIVVGLGITLCKELACNLREEGVAQYVFFALCKVARLSGVLFKLGL